LLKTAIARNESEGLKDKKIVSKGNTPSATTAANSRGTHSPVKKMVTEDGKRSALAKSVPRKTSVGQAQVERSPQVPKGLKSAHKSRIRSDLAGSRTKQMKQEILTIHELIDLDTVKFEQLNRSTVNFSYHLYNMMESTGCRAYQSPSKKQQQHQQQQPHPLKTKKIKVSDVHVNVGTSKRINPMSDSARKKARRAWESLNVKMDHIARFTTSRDKVHRVL
jgi:hypothetical protein